MYDNHGSSGPVYCVIKASGEVMLLGCGVIKGNGEVVLVGYGVIEGSGEVVLLAL